VGLVGAGVGDVRGPRALARPRRGEEFVERHEDEDKTGVGEREKGTGSRKRGTGTAHDPKVIPAQAGIHVWPSNMDSRSRGNDPGWYAGTCSPLPVSCPLLPSLTAPLSPSPPAR
jgi:hypothetical protein